MVFRFFPLALASSPFRKRSAGWLAGLSFLLSLSAQAQTQSLKPFKDELFAYPAALSSGDDGAYTVLDYREMRDINQRDEVPDDPEHLVEIGKAKIVNEGRDVSIFATSRMVIESRKAADLLAADGISAEVIDLRSLRPLDLAAIKASIAKTHHAVVVNEGWRFCGYAAEMSATIMDHAFDDLDAPVARVTLPDMPVPYSEPLEMAVLPNATKIADAARNILK